ncbi:MAG: 7TM-DISM domain-containing protein [Cytophagales bacterium]|nr:7TM-DISM domain-containing protein [Cytophagales bacterium]
MITHNKHPKKNLKYFYLLLILGQFGVLIKSNGQVNYDDLFTSTKILYEDKNVLTYSQVTNLDTGFIPYKIYDTLSSNTFWIKTNYYNPDKSKSIFITYPYILHKNIQLYYKYGDSLIHQTSYIGNKFSNQPYYFADHIFQLPNLPDTVQLLFRAETFFPTFFFSTNDTKSFVHTYFNLITIDFFFIGCTVLALLFSFFLLLYLKEKVYLFYAFFNIMILFERLVHNGYIFHFLPFRIKIEELSTIYHLYTVPYVGATIFGLLYIIYFLNIQSLFPTFFKYFIGICIFRSMLLILSLFLIETNYYDILTSSFIDVLVICCIYIFIILSFSKLYGKLLLFALGSLTMLFLGNIFHSISIIKSEIDSITIYLLFNNMEVIFFLIATGYRNNHLKKMKDTAQIELIKQFKENERIKDKNNRELEEKINERTHEISELMHIMKLNNIQLSEQVSTISKARVLQKQLSFEEFCAEFPSEADCLKYLANIKWKNENTYYCRKCYYKKYVQTVDYARRCNSCGYLEAPITHTLFHNIKFPLQKAFYILYTTHAYPKMYTLDKLSEVLALRKATCWAFKQKVLELIKSTKNIKKQKDGWTYLIEYSLDK